VDCGKMKQRIGEAGSTCKKKSGKTLWENGIRGPRNAVKAPRWGKKGGKGMGKGINSSFNGSGLETSSCRWTGLQTHTKFGQQGKKEKEMAACCPQKPRSLKGKKVKIGKGGTRNSQGTCPWGLGEKREGSDRFLPSLWKKTG